MEKAVTSCVISNDRAGVIDATHFSEASGVVRLDHRRAKNTAARAVEAFRSPRRPVDKKTGNDAVVVDLLRTSERRPGIIERSNHINRCRSGNVSGKR